MFLLLLALSFFTFFLPVVAVFFAVSPCSVTWSWLTRIYSATRIVLEFQLYIRCRSWKLISIRLGAGWSRLLGDANRVRNFDSASGVGLFEKTILKFDQELLAPKWLWDTNGLRVPNPAYGVDFYKHCIFSLFFANYRVPVLKEHIFLFVEGPLHFLCTVLYTSNFILSQ